MALLQIEVSCSGPNIRDRPPIAICQKIKGRDGIYIDDDLTPMRSKIVKELHKKGDLFGRLTAKYMQG
jgi:hypothetical protein